jgi:hypothetical protein
MRHSLCCLAVLLACTWTSGQTLKRRPEKSSVNASPTKPPVHSFIPLTVPAGTPLKVALDREIRIRKVGQPIYARTTEPVYAFDQLVVPTGTRVIGTVSKIDAIPTKTRILAATDANFSPNRSLRIEFNELLLADGRHVPIHTSVAPGSGSVLRFVPADGTASRGKIAEGKQLAKGKLAQARQQAKRRIEALDKELHAKGKIHRLKRFAVSQLPYRPQYLDAGTSFNAELQQPLRFGTEELRAEMVAKVGTQPPSGSTVHAWLATPLNSATSKKGDPVEAIISRPLVVSDQLILPEGSRLEGSVLQVRPARRLDRNGQLRITFHEIVPPRGVEQKMEATLEGLEIPKDDNLKLDSEGGARVTTPKIRYLTAGIAVMLAASSAAPDADRGLHHGGGDAAGGAANGASGFKLIGTLAGTFAHSRLVTTALGAYGAALAAYSHFLARGRDVVYPKDMSMVLALGSREKHPLAPGSAMPVSQVQGRQPGN